jgi:hypothetical protein
MWKLLPLFFGSASVVMQNSKQYFVKYTNLAHVHNLWVPKAYSIDTPRGPDLLSLLKNRNHTEKEITFVVNFRTENRWIRPCRELCQWTMAICGADGKVSPTRTRASWVSVYFLLDFGGAIWCAFWCKQLRFSSDPWVNCWVREDFRVWSCFFGL